MSSSQTVTIPNTMHAIRVSHTGGADVLEYKDDVPVPQPASGEVLVKIDAAGVNYIDTYFREGIYPTDMPYTPGVEGVGRVVAKGEDNGDASSSGELSVGDRVAFYNTNCSYAEYAAVPASAAVAIEETIDDPTAASLMTQGITAHYLSDGCYSLGEGDTCVITAGSGGVGLLLTQMAKARGATVISITSTEEKAQLSRDNGADYTINYDDYSPEKIRELTDGRGADVVYDGVGKTTFDTSIHSLRPTGTMVLFGAASGPVPPIDPQLLNEAGSVFLTRPSIKDWTSRPGELQSRVQAVVGMVANGSVKFRIGGTFPLSEARTAHEQLQARKTTGSLVLIP